MRYGDLTDYEQPIKKKLDKVREILSAELLKVEKDWKADLNSFQEERYQIQTETVGSEYCQKLDFSVGEKSQTT